MDRQRAVILVLAGIAVLVASVVFKVRVFVAGGKWLVTLIVIVALAVMAWPRERR
jgi:hypothetical protein